MHSSAHLLVLSNGVAEDLVGAALAAAWQRRYPDGRVLAAPLLGEGRAYQQAGIPLLHPGMKLPSGGFTRLGWRAFLADWRAGWWRETRDYIKRLRQARIGVVTASVARRGAGLAGTGETASSSWLCVGDVYLLTLGWWALRTPAWFVPTAKSQFIRGHLGLEVAWLRDRTRAIFARDEPTAQALAAAGLPARYVGNPLLDVGGAGSVTAAITNGPERTPESRPRWVQPSEGSGPRRGGGRTQSWVGWTVGLLPGSRQDWEENLEKLEEVVAALQAGCGAAESMPGASVRLVVAAPASGRLASADGEVEAVPFRTLLEQADLVLGLAGTAHEQAAGLGIPVVAAPWGRLQYTERFARAQQRLLGPALLLCPPEVGAVARAVRALLADPDRRRWMGAAGRQRMGQAGAVERIVSALAESGAEAADAKEARGAHDP